MDFQETHINFYHLLPASERDDARILEQQVENISTLAKDYNHALALFESSHMLHETASDEFMKTSLKSIYDLRSELPPGSPEIEAALKKRDELDKRTWAYISWINIAARDACVTLSNFKDCLCAIREGLTRCASIRSFVTVEEIEQAIGKFRADFPAYVVARDAAVHRIDKTFNLQKFEKNATSKPFEIPGFITSAGTDVMIAPQMMGRAFVGTSSLDKAPGEAFTLDLFSKAAHDKLNGLADSIRSRFLEAQAIMATEQREARFRLLTPKEK